MEAKEKLSVHCDWYVSEGQGSFHWTRKEKNENEERAPFSFQFLTFSEKSPFVYSGCQMD